jgi:L-lysine exporter family protein LysE/ArgO
MKDIFFEGMLIQASLIFALGPQNLFVLESGLRRQHQLTVSLTCYLCDFALIMLGVLGTSTFFNYFPQLKIIIGGLGVAFLIFYGVGKILSDEEELKVDELSSTQNGLKKAILNSVTFSVLNPHAYLDGIVLIGGYSAKYSEMSDRVSLGLGASTFSLIWFITLSYGAGSVMPLFANQKRMRFLMSTAGFVLLFLSAKLSVDVLGWLHEIYPETAWR